MRSPTACENSFIRRLLTWPVALSQNVNEWKRDADSLQDCGTFTSHWRCVQQPISAKNSELCSACQVSHAGSQQPSATAQQPQAHSKTNAEPITQSWDCLNTKSSNPEAAVSVYCIPLILLLQFSRRGKDKARGPELARQRFRIGLKMLKNANYRNFFWGGSVN